ncbi:MAG TPA: DoxX family protein [Staphylococcus kloosii]|uniref:DoxX family protein n=1 Tax=Staphylococcus kloosii TaxID=29384 RepID=A0A921H135_9STAP|nr:DoxX family protein [Staphylococcus kloosii]HJF68342.1 DoxX family protein [Staphylococcus kloosii]
MGVIIIILQVLLGIIFIITGSKIVSGAMNEEFVRMGYPQVFNQITGAIELLGALNMLFGIFNPYLAMGASVILGCTMLAGALSLIFLAKDPLIKALPATILLLLNVLIFCYYI